MPGEAGDAKPGGAAELPRRRRRLLAPRASQPRCRIRHPRPLPATGPGASPRRDEVRAPTTAAGDGSRVRTLRPRPPPRETSAHPPPATWSRRSSPCAASDSQGVARIQRRHRISTPERRRPPRAGARQRGTPTAQGYAPTGHRPPRPDYRGGHSSLLGRAAPAAVRPSTGPGRSPGCGGHPASPQ